MNPKFKILLLALCLMLPYVSFVLYRAFSYPDHPFPGWFLYVGPFYFFGSIALLVVLGKRIVGDARPTDFGKQRPSASDIEVDRRRLKLLWMGAGIYSLIFINGIRLGFVNTAELPLVAIICGELINGAILATFILSLRKVYKRVQDAGRAISD
jgi:hypothetical protein